MLAGMLLYPTERTIGLVTVALAGVCLFLIWQKGITVAAGDYAYTAGFAAVMLAIGQFYRQVRQAERIALTTHVMALFVVYSAVASLFNLLLLPRPAAPIDALLVRIDAWLGYSWPVACAWIAQFPQLSDALRALYRLTLVQLLFSFLFLGMSGEARRLHVAALATVIASLVTIFLWALLPSAGASAMWTLAPDIDRIVRPVVSSAYSAEVTRLIAEGTRNISTLNVTGLVGFPSFHTVMALVSLIAVWPYRPLRIPVLLVNGALLPAILIYGGHHLLDVLGGVAVTLVSWPLAAVAHAAQNRGLAARPLRSPPAAA